MDRDRFLDVSAARLRYRDEGSGPVIVLLHGWSLDLDMWEPQVEALSRSFRLIRFDRRGYGLSSGKPSLADDVLDVQVLCRHLGVQRAAFLGMSQGARILHHLASAIPESICCLVFDGPPDLRPGGVLTAQDVPLSEYTIALRDEGIEAVRRRWGAHALTRLRTEDRTAHMLLSRMLGRYTGTDLTLSTAEATRTFTPLRLQDIHLPALVLNGEFDLHSRRLAGRALVRLLPNAEYQIIGGAGHLANLDQPQTYNEVLRRFLERYALAPSPHRG
ncbi:MAG: alpha/beta fold hydrolase [Steroidobacteraceae bacterium]